MNKTTLLLLLTLAISRASAEDVRLRPPIDLNTHRAFPKMASAKHWEVRAEAIRRQVQVSCGLWPMPEKSDLDARVFGRIERDGYTVEKVAIQTLPGFYLAGNLYRPLGKGQGPFPGVLNPHGHWANGRMADTELGSIAGRCINFARQGMVAFSYDMVGYNDTRQVDHKFAADPANQLWNISLMGLQTWNSIRALDFLESLPDVDRSRLACTGESGGGTQTFILGAIDERLAVQAPIVMVSHSMQGGCLCENAPGLRVNFSNIEIAAAPAPRPQMIVSATGDWTRDTMSIEGPSIASIYRLLGAPEKFRYALHDFDHNYNKTTRETVYSWFGRWLLHQASAPVKEVPFTKEPDSDLRVWPDNKLPADALNQEQLVAFIKDYYQSQLTQLQPEDKAGLDALQETLLPAWMVSVQCDLAFEVSAANFTKSDAPVRFTLGRKDSGEEIPAVFIPAQNSNSKLAAILLHPEGKGAHFSADAGSKGLARVLAGSGASVLLLDTFLTGEQTKPGLASKRDYTKNYFTTYNRTDIQERIQDILTACAFLKERNAETRIALVGEGRAGLLALAAAPLADAVVADWSGFDESQDSAFMAQDLFFPGVRKLGGLTGIAALGAPNPILIHNTSGRIQAGALHQAYAAVGKGSAAEFHEERVEADQIAQWIGRL